ncbi:unnamed protein product [Arctogadus glacialis]
MVGRSLLVLCNHVLIARVRTDESRSSCVSGSGSLDSVVAVDVVVAVDPVVAVDVVVAVDPVVAVDVVVAVDPVVAVDVAVAADPVVAVDLVSDASDGLSGCSEAPASIEPGVTGLMQSSCLLILELAAPPSPDT